MTNVVTVVQCWDDGVTTDARLVDIFRRHGAKATFNLNAGLHEPQKNLAWTYKGVPVTRLNWSAMQQIYAGFTIANHSLTHPNLEQIPMEIARREIIEGRERLQQFFGQPVIGFAYPFGTYNEVVMELVREAGHQYARTTHDVEQVYPPGNPMAFHPSCHFLASDFWLRYEKAREVGAFYFWGHSYELVTENMWDAFEKMIEQISTDPAVRWGNVADLFEGAG